MKFAGLNVDPKLGLADVVRDLERRSEARAGRRYSRYGPRLNLMGQNHYEIRGLERRP